MPGGIGEPGEHDLLKLGKIMHTFRFRLMKSAL